MDASANRQTFDIYAKQFIKRKGIDNLMDWIATKTDFYTAPASTRFHSAYEGGLVAHSIYTFVALGIINKSLGLNYSDETIAICGLFHDLCKVEFYEKTAKNVKVYCADDVQSNNSDELGYFNWQTVIGYKVRDDDPYPAGHGEKSAFLLSKFMNLSTEETLAIRWHMGGFDDAVKGGSYDMAKAYRTYPLCAIIHMADIAAANIYETRCESQAEKQPAASTSDAQNGSVTQSQAADAVEPLQNKEPEPEPQQLDNPLPVQNDELTA